MAVTVDVSNVRANGERRDGHHALDDQSSTAPSRIDDDATVGRGDPDVTADVPGRRAVEALLSEDSIEVEVTTSRPWKYAHAMRRMIPVRGKRRDNECPFERAGLLSLLTFHWIQPLMWRVFKRGLGEEDIWLCPKSDSAAENAKRLERLWRSALERDGESASLWYTLWRLCRTSVVVSCVAHCVHVIISFMGPAFVLRELLSGLEKRSFTLFGGLLLALLLAVTELMRTMSNSVFFTLNYQMGIRMQGAVTTMVYDKILRLRHLQQKSAGDFVNLFSSDSQRLFSCMPSGLTLISGPLISVMSLVYLWCTIGWTVLIGFSVILLVYPLQILVSRLINTYRTTSVKITDRRVRLMNEVLSYVKLIKMYAWEAPFSESVNAIRGEERRVLEEAQFLKSMLMTLVPPIPTVAAVLTLIAHTQLGYQLSVAEAFTLLAVFNCVRPKLSTVSAAVICLSEGKIAADRFEKILRMEEVGVAFTAPSDEGVAVQLCDASLGWDVWEENEEMTGPSERPRYMSSSAGGDDIPRPLAASMFSSQSIKSNGANVDQNDYVIALRDINISVAKGSLLGVCGKYGSGKSSLLSAILGQMKLISGSVHVSDDFAYVSQQAFILNASVKENILFGSKYDKQRYENALRVCELNDDVRSFPSGDETEIGERGINLSGGQKQRLSLARAVYSDKEIYLLDAVLSAVDVSVGSRIFTKCITSQLKSKTVILVTHQLQYLEDCDEVLFLKAGRLHGNGTHQRLMAENEEYAELVNTFHREMKSQEETVVEESESEDEDALTPPQTGLEFSSVYSIASVVSEAPAQTNGHAGKLIEAEGRSEGRVDWAVYRAYVQSAGGSLVAALVMFIFVLNVSCGGLSDWWLSYWLSQGAGNFSSNGTDSSAVSANPDLWFYNTVHAGIIATIVITSFIRSFTVMKTTLHASSTLHERLFGSVMSGAMSFFDTTPAGRILNRFAKDLDDADTKLPTFIESSLQNVLRTLMALIIICVVFPYFLVAVVPLLVFFLFIQHVFRCSLRELKRLESMSRSPVLSRVMCSVQGLYTLQAYGRCEEYGREYRRLQDKNSMLTFLHHCAKRWLTIRLDLVANSVVLFTAVLAVVLRDRISPAYAGLALNYAIQMTGLLQFTLRLVLETEAIFTSVERIHDYIVNIEPEGKLRSGESTTRDLPPSWPSVGEIRLESVRMRYRPGLPCALRDISTVISAREKVGIVGRTGSGKSSLCLVLFRLVELSSGRILIDGSDIAHLHLHFLRSRLAIIPQDPVLFAGSVRYNIDPFMENSDEDVWNALHQCHISPKIKSLPGKLDYVLVENGGNFSVGERQLVCLARALLRRSKILVMDEATASVDAVTDSLIQTTIANSFCQCTILIIAHRLHTVKSCDKILVLKRGKLVEYDTPQNLLANPNSAFSHMTRTMRAHMRGGLV